MSWKKPMSDKILVPALQKIRFKRNRDEKYWIYFVI